MGHAPLSVVSYCHQWLEELHSPQFIAEQGFHARPTASKRARQGFLLEIGPELSAQCRRPQWNWTLGRWIGGCQWRNGSPDQDFQTGKCHQRSRWQQRSAANQRPQFGTSLSNWTQRPARRREYPRDPSDQHAALWQTRRRRRRSRLESVQDWSPLRHRLHDTRIFLDEQATFAFIEPRPRLYHSRPATQLWSCPYVFIL